MGIRDTDKMLEFVSRYTTYITGEYPELDVAEYIVILDSRIYFNTQEGSPIPLSRISRIKKSEFTLSLVTRREFTTSIAIRSGGLSLAFFFIKGVLDYYALGNAVDCEELNDGLCNPLVECFYINGNKLSLSSSTFSTGFSLVTLDRVERNMLFPYDIVKILFKSSVVEGYLTVDNFHMTPPAALICFLYMMKVFVELKSLHDRYTYFQTKVLELPKHLKFKTVEEWEVLRGLLRDIQELGSK